MLGALVSIVMLSAPADADEGAVALHATGLAVMRAPTAALILSGQSGGSIEIVVTAFAMPVGGPEPRLCVVTEISGGSLSATAEALDLFVYVLGATGEVVDTVGQQLVLDRLATGTEKIERSSFKVFTLHTAPSGPMTVRVLVNDQSGADYGLQSRIIDLPDLAIGTSSPLSPGLPAGLDPWLKEALLHQATSELASEARRPIVVQSRVDPPSVGASGAVVDRDAGGEGDAVARLPQRRWGRILPREETLAAYRLVLLMLAESGREGVETNNIEGGLDAARSRLRELEVGARQSAAAVLELGELEWQVLESLARRAGWDGLLPVIDLHSGLIVGYREVGASPLAEHSIRISRRLARTIARRAKGEVRADVSRALTRLAGQLMRFGRQGEAQELFETALEADAFNPNALLGLAISHERLGRAEQTVDVLGRLIRLDPHHAEGRLRLALNLERVDQPERARDLLASLITDPVPNDTVPNDTETDWVAMLAFQEMARLDLRDGQLGEAAKTLRQALRRWPNHPGLLIQLAFVRDRAGSPAEAQQLIARAVASPLTIESARDRYNRWPRSSAPDRDRERRAGVSGG